jgi:hypothetical protein
MFLASAFRSSSLMAERVPCSTRWGRPSGSAAFLKGWMRQETESEGHGFDWCYKAESSGGR